MSKDPLISPSQLLRSNICLHAYALDCHGDRSQKRQESLAEKSVKQEGLAFQEAIVRNLPGVKLQESTYADMAQGAALTRQWMTEGSPWISQGVLTREDLCGIPDLLKKIPGRSALGPYSYQPVEIKSHRALSLQDRLQLFFYAHLLEPMLGHRPPSGVVISPDGVQRDVPFSPHLEKYFFDLLGQMKQVRNGELETEPVRCSGCARCLWSDVCLSVWEETGHISLLSGVGLTMSRKLAQEGISTCAQVAACDEAVLSEITGIPHKSAQRMVQAARARVENRPFVIQEPSFAPGGTHYFYDIETLDDIVFCHGVVRVRNGKAEERSFFARSPQEEKKIWHELLDFFAEEKSETIYCWTFYERYFVESSWKKFQGNRKGYENLIRGLKDQCAFVRDHFALPCRGYSIKVVAPYFGFEWQGEDANGMNCVAWYKRWLETGGEEWRERVVQYNLDDVRAMVHVDRKLRVLFAE